ncbi:factor 2 [Mactra antiquata]
MMDSPLNQAHQQGRKADALMKSGKFEEAVACHNRAAEFMLEAMQQTRYGPALESLKLQHAHHLKQTDRLYDRQRRAHMLQIKLNKLQHSNQSTQTLLQGPVVPVSSEISHQPAATSMSLQQSNDANNSLSDVTSPLDEDSIYRTLTENDSLIGLLLRRRQNLDSDNSASFHSGVPVERVFSATVREDVKQLGGQVATETEDLKAHNDDLRKHVQHLLKELDDIKKENKELKDKYEGSKTLFSEPCLIPDLPPLEMPQFDVDLLEWESKKKGDDSDSNLTQMSL